MQPYDLHAYFHAHKYTMQLSLWYNRFDSSVHRSGTVQAGTSTAGHVIRRVAQLALQLHRRNNLPFDAGTITLTLLLCQRQ